MVKVKVCGLKRPADALVAAEAGADFVSMIFVEGVGRQIAPEQGRAIAEAVRAWKRQGAEKDRAQTSPVPGEESPSMSGRVPSPLVVGVFANQPVEYVDRVAREVGLDYVQLSGNESEEVVLQIERPVIRVMRLPSVKALPKVASRVEWLQKRRDDALILLDSATPGALGGSGERIDLRLAAAAAREFDFLLAGGLDPGNVAEAIERVHPWGVDASSGLETNGVKDAQKIRDFVSVAKGAAVS